MNKNTQTHLILPVGTRVVTRIDDLNSAGNVARAAGAVGEIVKAPVDAEHSYRVAFGDGGEAAYKRGQFSILKQFKDEAMEAAQILFCKFGLVHSPDLGESSDCMLR